MKSVTYVPARLLPISPVYTPLRGVARRGEGCYRSIKIGLEGASKSHPPFLRNTSLKGGGLRSGRFKSASQDSS